MNKSTVDFLGIGAQRSASTWLDRNLRRHPQIWMPPLKVLHYFDRSPDYASPSYLACESWGRGVFGNQPQDKAWRRSLIQRTSRHCWREGASLSLWQDLAWIGRCYFGSPITDDWYRSLFAPGEGLVKGEITPAYGILDDPMVAHIPSLFPEPHIIFIIRNPIDRALSQLAMHRDTGLLPGRIDAQAMLDFLVSPEVSERNDYPAILNHWGANYNSDQLFIGWCDDIVSAPQNTLDSIMQFLGLAPLCNENQSLVMARHNEAMSRGVPAGVVKELADIQRPNLVTLADTLGGHAVKWLAQCDELLA